MGISSKWMVSGLGDEMIRDQIYRHPDSPTEGAALECQIVSFERIKLTNNDSPKYGQVSTIAYLMNTCLLFSNNFQGFVLKMSYNLGWIN